MKFNQNGFVSIVALLGIAILVAGGIYYVVASGEDEDGNVVQETVAQVTQDQIDEANADNAQLLNDGAYPALYQQYNLPEYPNATLTYDGRTADNLSDGISLALTTPDDVQSVGAFFASALGSLPGWVYTPPNFSNDSLYGGSADKADENLHYQFTITQLPDHTLINVSFLEN